MLDSRELREMQKLHVCSSKGMAVSVSVVSHALGHSEFYMYVWEAPSWAQWIKASLMTIACKMAELFAFLTFHLNMDVHVLQ